VAKPAVLFAEQSALALKQGFDQIASLLALTLGPTQGHILNARDNKEIEPLTDSAVVARRIIALPHQAVNVGAMLMRSLAWRVHQQAGDGVATTAVLAQAILIEAFKYVRAGGNPALVRRGVDQAAKIVFAELAKQAQPVTHEDALTGVAETITAEPDLSLVLGEMFEILGPQAHITIEDYVAPYLERAYFDGGRWQARLESPYFITDNAGLRAVQNNCQVVLLAGNLKTPADVQPLLERLVRLEKPQLLLVAHEISREALGFLVVNHQKEKIKSVAVTLRRPANRRAEDFADLAAITGATVLGDLVGRSLKSIKPEDLGQVRRVEATADHLIISGGGGDATARRQYIEQLHARLTRLPESDEERNELRLRLARLSGGVGLLKLGAQTKPERSALHQKAEKAVRSLRLAMAQGVVPGGGVAYLRAIPAVQKFAQTLTGDEQRGAQILARALEAPLRQIAKNRGLTDPSVVLARLNLLGPDYLYDALTDELKPVAEANLFDPVGVLRFALETAVSGAMLTLTTGAIVLHRKPKESLEPS